MGGGGSTGHGGGSRFVTRVDRSRWTENICQRRDADCVVSGQEAGRAGRALLRPTSSAVSLAQRKRRVEFTDWRGGFGRSFVRIGVHIGHLVQVQATLSIRALSSPGGQVHVPC